MKLFKQNKTQPKIVYSIFRGNPRTDTTAEKLETFDRLDEALKKLAEFRYKEKTDNIFVREEVIHV